MKIMGILNATPDSFSDGGRFLDPDAAVRRAVAMAADGADIIDVGGESTRPGATPIGWEEEWSRIEPALRGLGACGALRGAAISVDTYHPETAERAVAAGAAIVNCVYAVAVPAMLEILAANPGVELVMPAKSFPLLSSLFPAPSSLFPLSRIYLDPMIGFGTTREEDFALLRSVPELARKGRVLVGASRKRIVRTLAGESCADSVLGGDVAVALWCMANGASVVRVHDVREVAQAVKVMRQLSKPALSTPARDMV